LRLDLRDPRAAVSAQRERLQLVILLLVFLFLSPVFLPVAGAVDSPVQILGVNYPRVVRSGESFFVTIETAYSSKFGMMDIGLWDIENGTVIQEVVSNATQAGPGESAYTLMITAPGRPIVWHLAAIARVWLQDAWFYDAAGEVDFSVNVIDHAFLALTNLQPNSSLRIDGTNVTVRVPSVVVPLSLGATHTVEVSALISLGPGRRLALTGWSDGVESNPRSVVLSENVTLAPVYRMQYFLTASSELGETQGGGWYWAGDTALFGIPSTTLNASAFLGLPVGSYHFAAWSGDSGATSATTAISMNGPKQVRARWVYEPAGFNPGEVEVVFVIASVILFVRAIWLLSRLISRDFRFINPAAIISCFSLILLILMPVTAAAGIPIPIKPTVVTIGDAAWYYWAQPASDSCVLWLGGGVEYSQGGYLINPFEYESFGTIRFLQDISKHYCLLVLDHGSSPASGLPNRTIFQELIQRHSALGRQAHQWLNDQGYRHVFLTGYSVGAEAAAALAIDDSRVWSSSDGLILITSRLSQDLIADAPTLNTNLMILYGNAPTFEPSGERFYQLAPTEGWHGTGYLHKEYHVLDQMSHEVWSPLKDNTYSPIALGMLVNFIQISIASQFGPLNFSGNPSVISPEFVIDSLYSPSKTIVDIPFSLDLTIASAGRSPPQNESAVVVFDNSSMRSMASSEFLPNSTDEVHVLLSPTMNSSKAVLRIVVVTRTGSQWILASAAYFAAIAITDGALLRIGGLVSNSSVTLDNKTYSVPNDGVLRLNASIGIHSISVGSSIVESGAKYSFVEWNDGNMSAMRTITLEQDMNVSALYDVQYLVNVTSLYGAPGGSGWYDANSTLIPQLTACVRPNLVLDRWNATNSGYTTGEPIPVTSAMNIQAVWTEGPQSYLPGNSWIFLSMFAFSVLLLINIRLKRER